MKRLVTLILICLMLTGCGFHLRAASDFPSALKQLYFSSDSSYSRLSVELLTLFQAAKLHLVKKQSQTRFSLIVTRDHFAFSRPDIVNLSLPTNINFLQSVNIEIHDNVTHKTIASNYFEVDRSLTLNASQIYTATSNDAVRQELNRELATLIYYWLTSTNIKKALDKHATHTTTT